MGYKITQIENPDSKNDRKLRAVIYARYSSSKQNGASIEQQIVKCEKYISEKGYEYDFINKTDVYYDSATSAFKSYKKRKEFSNLLNDAKKKKFDVVVAFTLDRVSREGNDTYSEIENQLKQYGVKIEYATIEYTEDMGGAVLKTVHAYTAESYSLTLSTNTNRGMQFNARFGFYNGGRNVPLGYKIEEVDVRMEDGSIKHGKALVIDEVTSKYVKEAFNLYLKGSSTQNIADYLNKNGIHTTEGAQINKNTVNRMLQNTIYKGIKISTFDNKQDHIIITNDGYPKTIDESVWDKVQLEREKRAHKGGRKNARVLYELIDKLYCGQCGEKMCADTAVKKNKTYYYYACHNKKYPKKATHKCDLKNVPKYDIENVVMQIVSNCIWDKKLVQKYIKAAEIADKVESINPRIAELEREVKVHDEKLRRAVDGYNRTGIEAFLESAKEESEYKNLALNELKAIISQEDAKSTAKDFAKQIDAMRKLWCELQRTPEGRREIIKTFVHKIFVYPKDSDKKTRLKIIIRTDLDSNTADEIEAEFVVREQLAMGHQSHYCRTKWFSIRETILR